MYFQEETKGPTYFNAISHYGLFNDIMVLNLVLPIAQNDETC